MDCGRFNKLIDSYLDCQLAGSLLAEFHVHRLGCSRCSRVLSMLQAAGDVIAQDRSGEPTLSSHFADRVLQALPAATQKQNRSLWMVRLTASAAGLAAAASITLAFVLPTQTPAHRSGSVVAQAVAISEDSGLPAPRNTVATFHYAVASQSDLLPSKNDLLTGNAIYGAVDKVVRWTEYNPKTPGLPH